MHEAIDTIGNFEVDPSIIDIFTEVVFIKEILGDIRCFDPYIFWAIQWSAEVEVGDVISGKAGIFGGEYTVKLKFD